jgi:hypothetical protein
VAKLGALALSLALSAVALGLSSCGSDESEPSAEPFFFGIVPELTPAPGEFERMADGGVAAYRWPLRWSDIETRPGAYEWGATDELITNLARNEIRPLPFICCAPAIDGLAADRAPVGSPEAERALESFLRAATERYGPDGQFWRENRDLPDDPIRMWQIWNEPNSSTFYKPRPDADQYARLVAISDRAIKAVDPDAYIVLAGMGPSPNPAHGVGIPATSFLEQLYDDGAASHFDAAAVHPYAPTARRTERILTAVRETMDDEGDEGSGIVVTELGWGSEKIPSDHLAVGRQAQANRLRDSFSRLSGDRDRWDLRGVMWFTWRDAPNPSFCVWCDSAGLFAEDGTAKPSWRAFEGVASGRS